MLHRLRAPAILLVLAMAAVLVPLSAPVGSVPNVRTERIGGDNRYETAARIARSTFTQADTAILASGQNFPDALSGAALAGARSAPVLLTEFGALPGSTRDALQTLQVKDVLILGGPAAVSESVRANLVSQGYNVSRIEGANRYGTAAEVARRVALSGIGSLNGKRTAFLASGQNFPDALTAGPLAYVGRHPVLLTPSGNLAPETAQALRDLQIQHVVILGGTFAVSDAVKAEIERQSITTERLAGRNRADTATLVANFAISQFGFEGVNVGLARGDNYPDALAAGPNAAKSRAPIVLTSTPNTLAAETSQWLSDHFATVALIRVYGGPGAVSDPVLNEAKVAAQTSNQAASRLDLAAKATGTTGTDGGPKWQYQQTTKEMQLLATVTSNPPSSTNQTSASRPPVARQTVNFTVTPSQGDTGNSTLNLTATTDTNGVAKVTYTRNNPGFDTVTATLRDNTQLTDKVEVRWGADAQPIALTPDVDANVPINTDRTFTVTYPAADVPSLGETVNLTALELIDADPTNDPNLGALTFGGAATADPDADHTIAKIDVGPADPVATFTVRSSATTRITFMVFEDTTVNDNVDKTELRDKAGLTAFNAPGPTITVTPDDTVTLANGQQRVYNVLATDAAGAPFVQSLDVGFVELTDRDPTGQPIAGTTTRGELAWYDNDTQLSQTPLVDHQTPSGATPLADNVTRTEVVPNAQGKFSFAITTDISERFAATTTGTPVVWLELPANQNNEREANETQDRGGATTWTTGSRLNGTLESLGCVPGYRAPELGTPEGQHPDCAPLDVAAVTPDGANAATRPFPVPPLEETPITGDASSRGDVVFRFTNRDVLGNPVVPGDSLFGALPPLVLFSVQVTSTPLPLGSVSAAPGPHGEFGLGELTSSVSQPVLVGAPLFQVVPFIQDTPYAELVVDADSAANVRVDVIQVLMEGAALVTGCGPLFNGPFPAPFSILTDIGLIDCHTIMDTASWASVTVDTVLPGTFPTTVPLSANCPAGPRTCFNGNIVTVDHARKYYVLNTGNGNVYVVYAVGRGGEHYATPKGERRTNLDTYFIEGIQTQADQIIDNERCTNRITGTQTGAGLSPAPGCARFDVNLTPDDRLVYEPYSELQGTTRVFPNPGRGLRIQTHRLTNT